MKTKATTLRTKRIELEGAAGNLAIERKPDSTTIRVDSILRDPKPGEKAWETWELYCHADEEQVLEAAEWMQRRTDGRRGTDTMINEYYRELQRFAG